MRSLTAFTYLHHRILTPIRKYTHRQNLVTHSITRFTTTILGLGCLVDKTPPLAAMAPSEVNQLSRIKPKDQLFIQSLLERRPTNDEYLYSPLHFVYDMLQDAKTEIKNICNSKGPSIGQRY